MTQIFDPAKVAVICTSIDISADTRCNNNFFITTPVWRNLYKEAFTLCATSRRAVAARMTLKMGYKKINRVVYTMRHIVGHHNDHWWHAARNGACSHLIAPARNIASNPLTKPLEGHLILLGKLPGLCKQLLYSSVIFDVRNPRCGVNYHCCVAPLVLRLPPSVNVA